MNALLKSIKDNKAHYLAFLFIFIILSILMIQSEETAMSSDAKNYWDLGCSYFDKNVETPDWRGYIYPAFLGITNIIGGFAAWKLVNSLLISFLFAFVFPDLIAPKNDHGSLLLCFKILGSYIIFSMLFLDIQTVTLTDLPAFMVCVWAVWLARHITENHFKWYGNAFLSFLLGVLLYWMYNIRTIYLFAALGILIVCVIEIIKEKKKLTEGIITVGGELFGVFFASIPQLIVNYQRYGEKSIAVRTNGLFVSQLFWGLQYQRYDTYIGSEGPVPQVFFVDASGTNLLLEPGVGGQSMQNYLSICFSHPIEILGVYTRHFVNMLTPFWNKVYIEELQKSKLLIVLVSFTVLFLFIYALFNKFENNKLHIWILPLLIPVIMITPGAVEARFFVALHFIMICTLAYNVDWKRMKQDLKKHSIRFVLLYLASFCLFVAIWTNTLASYSGEISLFIE